MKKLFAFLSRISLFMLICMAFTYPVQLNANQVVSNISKSSLCKGVVVDAKKVPIIGAAVMIKGTTRGAVTDINGNFSLGNVKYGSILEVSYIGYSPRRIIWKGQKLDIILKEDSKLLTESVVVGMGTQKRNTITASVATVGAKMIKDRPVTDVTSVLEGNVAGLNISTAATENNTQGGELGGDIKFNIRGIGSINGGEPYVLVDGVEQSLSSVNPADIANITVLKDASSAAVYGSRAAYGVVLVTTKSGKKNSFKIDYNASFGASSPINLPHMMTALQYAHYKDAYALATGQKIPFSEGDFEAIKAFSKHPYSPENPGIQANLQDNYWRQGSQTGDTDWFKYFFKDNSFKQMHNLSISGGSEKVTYYIGLGVSDQNGLLRSVTDNFRKYTLNTNFSIRPKKWLKIALNNNLSYIHIKRPLPNMTIVFHNIARTAANMVTHLPIKGPYNIPTWNQNLLMKQCHYNNHRIADAIKLSGTITPLQGWDIVASLSSRFNMNLDSFIMGQPKWSKPNGEIQIVAGTTQGYGPNGWNWRQVGWMSYSRNTFYDVYLSPNIYTSYSTAFGKHFLKAMMGFQAEYDFSSYLRAYKTGVMSDDVFSFKNASGNFDLAGDRNHWATEGFYTRINYNYNNMFFLEFSGRTDGSSRFAPGHRWGVFPSASAGVDMAQTEWFQNLFLNNPVSQLKIRASYGRLGNQNAVGLYQYYNLIPLSPNNPGAWLLPGINNTPARGTIATVPNLASLGLTWEKVDTGDLGLDLTAFNDRLTATLDLYQRDTRDMVGPAESIPSLSGIPDDQRPKENNANLRTRGWELSISWSDSFKSGFNYSIGLNLSNHYTIITKYNNPNGLIRNNFTGLSRNKGFYQGMDVGEIWGYKADHLFISNSEIDKYLSKVDLSYFKPDVQWQRGDVKFEDINHDGKVNPGAGTLKDHGDLMIIGNATPRYNFGINLSVGYKNFTVSALLQGVGKRQFPISGSTYMFGAQQNFFKYHLNYYNDKNLNGYLPRLANGKDYSVNTGYNTTRYLLNAAYMRLKSLTISYTVPTNMLKSLHIKGLRIYCSGENLLTFTKLPPQFDPETINQVNTWAGGSNDYAPGLTSPLGGNGNGKVYPLNRNYVFGFDISF